MDAAGQLLVSGDADGVLALWDVEQTVRRRSWKAHQSDVTAIAVNRDGTLAVSAGWDGTVALWELQTQREVHRISIPEQPPISVTIHGSAYITVGTRGGQLTRYRVGKNNPVRSYVGHTNGITSLAECEKSGRLVSISSDGTLRIWDMATGACFGCYKAVPPRIGRTRGINLDGSRQEHVELPTGLAAGQSGLAFSSATDGTVKVWDVEVDQTQAEPEAHTGPVHSVDLSPDCQWAVSTSAVDNVARFWDLDGRCFAAMPGADKSEFCDNEGLGAVAVTAESQYGAAATSDGRLRAWDRKGLVASRTRGAAPPTWDVKALPSDGAVLVAGELGVVAWHIPTGNVRPIIGARRITRIAVAEDGVLALAGGCGLENSVSLYDLPRQRCLASKPITGDINFLDISDRIVLCGCDGMLWTCRLSDDALFSNWICYEETGRAGRTYAGEHGRGMLSGTILPGSSRVLTGLQDFRVLVASVEKKEEVGYLVGHRDEIFCIRALPDGLHVLTASADQTIRLWNVGELRCLACYATSAPFTCASQIRSGRLAAGTTDGRVCLLELASWKPGPLRVRSVRRYRLAPKRWWDHLLGVNPVGSIDRIATVLCRWCGSIQRPPDSGRSFRCRECSCELRLVDLCDFTGLVP